MNDDEDLSTANEKFLGKIIKQKVNNDYFLNKIKFLTNILI